MPDIPAELEASIREFWPQSEWSNAADISRLESAWNAFAIRDSTSDSAPCGTIISVSDGISISAELSVGYFQINACNFPDWDWHQFFNARHNAGTAHMLWDQAGQSWKPWYFSAKALGLL